MHYSAKCGITIACHLSVRLSVTLLDQDHTGWKSWKLTARTVSATASLFVAERPSTNSRGNMGTFGKTRGGVGKNGMLEHKRGNIWNVCKDRGRLLWRAYRNSPTLFQMVLSPTPYGLLLPKVGVRNPHPKLQSLLSQERIKLRTSNS